MLGASTAINETASAARGCAAGFAADMIVAAPARKAIDAARIGAASLAKAPMIFVFCVGAGPKAAIPKNGFGDKERRFTAIGN